MIQVVLDTNVLASALLFEVGRLSWLRQAWQGGRIRPLLAEVTTRELLRVLTYPKFALTAADLETLLAELLPWCEGWAGPLDACPQRVRDPQDQMVLDLAVSAKAAALVHGDADRLVGQVRLNPLQTLDPASFRAWLPPIG